MYRNKTNKWRRQWGASFFFFFAHFLFQLHIIGLDDGIVYEHIKYTQVGTLYTGTI